MNEQLAELELIHFVSTRDVATLHVPIIADAVPKSALPTSADWAG